MKKISYFLFQVSIGLLMISCAEPKKKQMPETGSMLQHNVYFYLNDSISNSDRKEFEKGLQKLLSIDAIHKSEVGLTADTKPREVTDHDFDYSLFIWFKSKDNYEIYAEHPDHMEFIENYQSLWEAVKVYDSQIIKPNFD
ncbi:hypothetical protein MATR_18430 [Marivirga tractuosa]|uniref:Stress responsive alpha-beta barrel domain-containing protein n=1 Tax=Marivirga tractuosa (strain ATCC 23168 / DSM 4126 / NBRC 15989 / NCIMB 1408 / VKM B-1430 / H-43) TaxID=643867 RepID=E4TPX7_MARTH|nr:Dabb family protein [Marivirga tractuosa]ADR20534.1 Stress responsive alpha-beta barrel domain-containing protein [Marivirga tractuosa DSM 4126]BDD15018.1 hypothetical protein MATR_18430 [Marivirga tractuosa]